MKIHFSLIFLGGSQYIRCTRYPGVSRRCQLLNERRRKAPWRFWLFYCLHKWRFGVGGGIIICEWNQRSDCLFLDFLFQNKKAINFGNLSFFAVHSIECWFDFVVVSKILDDTKDSSVSSSPLRAKVTSNFECFMDLVLFRFRIIESSSMYFVIFFCNHRQLCRQWEDWFW